VGGRGVLEFFSEDPVHSPPLTLSEEVLYRFEVDTNGGRRAVLRRLYQE
jgi:hypothetical protein